MPVYQSPNGQLHLSPPVGLAPPPGFDRATMAPTSRPSQPAGSNASDADEASLARHNELNAEVQTIGANENVNQPADVSTNMQAPAEQSATSRPASTQAPPARLTSPAVKGKQQQQQQGAKRKQPVASGGGY